MSKARQLADLGNVYDDGALSNRNLIINGAMQVAQRGTSFTANGYGLDRWKTYNSGGTATLSQQTFASGSSPLTGVDNYIRVVRSSPSGIFYLSQRVEDVRKSDDATLTFSFYAKASSAVTIPCRITQEIGSGGSSGVNITAQNNNVTTSWQRFSMTFNMASLSGKTLGTGHFFEPVFDIPATTATVEITAVQVEHGDTATPFEHEPYSVTLQKAQRYYIRQTYEAFIYQHVHIGMALNTTYCAINIEYPVTMRGAPTLQFSSASSFRVNDGLTHDETCNNIVQYNTTKEMMRIHFYKATANMNVGYCAYINRETYSSPCWLAFDAEL